MQHTLPILLSDFYKQVHAEQYPSDITKLVSYFTPRMSRLKEDDKLICFGVQAFCKEYLIDYFNNYFFQIPESEVITEYNRVLIYTLGRGTYDDTKIRKLHHLGYLPLEIKCVPEGTRVPIKVPMIEISNTHPDFAWVTNAIESLMSATLWHTMLSANVGFNYRQIVNTWYDKTVSDDNPLLRARALGDFSFRGQHSLESATKSSAAFCLSFLNTATVPTIPWLEYYYNCDCAKENVAFGAISTEHSVMCSNYALDGDEKTFVKKLLKEIYPHKSFSMVSDSYDYWNMITNIIPSLANEILNHDGTLLVRGDSGDPVDIICGKEIQLNFESRDKFEKFKCSRPMVPIGEVVKIENEYYVLAKEGDGTEWKKCAELHPEYKGTVECLWETFGGTINSKGYKVLNSHIKAIYGDSITPQRCREIYSKLEKKGFAASNVVLGVGSFSFMCLEEPAFNDTKYLPYTRDTFGIAVKATYGECRDKMFPIFKNPKTDSGNFKKSQKGMCIVYINPENDYKITYSDGWGSKTMKDATELTDGMVGENLLQSVYKNSEMTYECTLNEIRNRLHAKTGGF